MATMEKKRSKTIGIFLIGLLVVLCLAILSILDGRANRDGHAKEGDAVLPENVSLQAGEDTPQSVMDRIDEDTATDQETEQARVEATESEEAKETEDFEESAEATKDQSSEEGQEETVSSDDVASDTQKADSDGGESKAQETINVGNAASPDDRVIDFAALQTKKNAHIYAWINVPGTNIDYPVLRHPTDDGYYLYHNLNGSSGYPGCIYTENWNSTDWTDPVTVLYGHDMRSTGTMFHQLHKFEKQSFFDQNQYIYIYTPDKTLKYRIFAAYVHSNEHLLYNHNFSNEDVFTSFFNTVMSSAGGVNHVREGMEVSADDKVITLSTCIKNQPNNRYLIFGVLE